MRLLIDMNLSPVWETYLLSAGLQAVHWSSLGRANAPDSTIIRYAALHHDCVLTSDLDFGIHLAMSGAQHPSVIQIRANDLLPHALGANVVHAIQQLSAELERGALVTIEVGRVRLRSLPFDLL